MYYVRRKSPQVDAWFARKQRKNPTVPSVFKKKRKHRKKKEPLKVRTFAVRRHKTTVAVEDSKFVMEYALTWEQIYRISKNAFDLNRMPKIEIAMNKSADLRDEFSSYCGQKKTIKNWLFYV